MQRCLALIAIPCLLSCGGRSDRAFDEKTFIVATLMMTLSEGDISAMAVQRARTPATRAIAREVLHDQRAMFAELAAIAKQRGIAVPRVPEPKRLALRQNLAILPGQVFDRGYLLAVVQDFETMSRELDAARGSGDRALETFARRHASRIARQRKIARQHLDRLGGSPFGFVP